MRITVVKNFQKLKGDLGSLGAPVVKEYPASIWLLKFKPTMT